MVEIPWDLGLAAISLLVLIYAFLLLNSKVVELQASNAKLQEGLDKILQKIDEVRK